MVGLHCLPMLLMLLTPFSPGELRIMFAQEDRYGDYMDRFFAKNHHPSISWIHDLGTGKHGAASETLLAESQDASDLEIKHVRHSHSDIEFIYDADLAIASLC